MCVILAPAHPQSVENGDVSSVKSMTTSYSMPGLEEGDDLNQAGLHLIRLVCMHACVRLCVCACVRACMHVCMCAYFFSSFWWAVEGDFFLW